MSQTNRALLRLVLMLALSFADGCSEYNRYPTRSEDDSLSNVMQLTRGFDRAGEASFSKDMRWVVFQAVPASGGDYQIYLAKVLSTDSEITGIDRPVRVTPIGSRNTSASISPDGLSLIFGSTANPSPDAANSMQLFRADGWEADVSVTNPAAKINLAQHPLTNGPPASECSFSPDGKNICYTIHDGASSSIYVMHSDGSRVVRITSTPGHDGGPHFSPDGTRLVYRSDRDGRNLPQIFLADLAFDQSGEISGMSAEHQLTHDDFINYGPRWHPDGKHIIYSTSREGKTNHELYLMDASGQHKTRITFFDKADLLPAFSPDGRYLLWTSRRSPDGTMQIFLARFGFPRGS